MNSALVSALVSAFVSVSALFLSDLFGRRRDRENDWRKVKLEQYREFSSALSNNVHRGNDETAQRRYADAVNNLVLVAPPSVLIPLYAFQEGTSYKNDGRSLAQYERLLSDLFREMRKDCQPKDPGDDFAFTFRTIGIPMPNAKS